MTTKSRRDAPRACPNDAPCGKARARPKPKTEAITGDAPATRLGTACPPRTGPGTQTHAVDVEANIATATRCDIRSRVRRQEGRSFTCFASLFSANKTFRRRFRGTTHRASFSSRAAHGSPRAMSDDESPQTFAEMSANLAEYKAQLQQVRFADHLEASGRSNDE